MPETSVLIIDDEKNILTSLRQAFELEGYKVGVAGNGEIGLEKLGTETYDIVLLDLILPGINGFETLKKIKQANPSIPVLMMSGQGTISQAVECIKEGAIDFLEKPFSPDKAIIAVKNTIRLSSLDESNRNLRDELYGRYQIIGESDVVKELLSKVDKAAPSRGRVLISGESGTGKELIARRIHFKSDRSSKSFVKVNCAAVPSELIESELFGHKKGSFTGAIADRVGKFKKADGGTIFLDEVGDMKLDMQAKLLRVLQEGEFEPVGSENTIKVDVRIIAATNKNLDHNIKEGTFRSDLFFRLNVIPIFIPPLRERKEDVPILAEFFLRNFCEENNKPLKKLNNDAVEVLKKQNWDGNVRELRNLCEQIIIMSSSEDIEISALQITSILNGKRKGDSGEEIYQTGKSLKDLTDDAERRVLLHFLNKNGWNMTATAAELQLERSHLYKKCKALGIEY